MAMYEIKRTYPKKDGTIVTKVYQYPYVSKKRPDGKRTRLVDRLDEAGRAAVLNYYETAFPELKNTFKISEEFNCVISSKGRLFSINTKHGELGSTLKNGYRCMTVVGNTYYVHQVVYKTFSEKSYDPCLQIDHIDGNRTNNDISNLRQLTCKENLEAAIQRRGGEHWRKGICGAKHVSSKPVYQYSKDGKLVAEWESQHLAATTLGIRQSGINDCVHGRIKTSHGYIWKNTKES